MEAVNQKISRYLGGMKGSGKFVSSHAADFVFPGLSVAGLGEVSFPINDIGAKALIDLARKAPFGKGSETIIDESVRKTWEIDASELHFTNPRWADFLKETIDKIKPELGLEYYDISAHLYKLLVYETGGFFLPHRDTEKEKGMFGTMVLDLPAHYSGGELLVSFEGVTETLSFAKNAGDYQLSCVAFYADCEHEVRPVTSGHRVSLVYNLVQAVTTKKLTPATIGIHVDTLKDLLKAHQEQEDLAPAIILLGHQYTPAGFSEDALKLNDRLKAEALLQAAKSAGYYAKMCLVTSFVLGAADSDGWDDDDDDAEMGEVLEESTAIEHWLPGDCPDLNAIKFEKEDLIASFSLEDDEPIETENSGYMGNWGPDISHWYYYGAVIVWSPETNARLFLAQDVAHQMDWIDFFNKNPERLGPEEKDAVLFILAGGFAEGKNADKPNYNAVADWLINEDSEDFFLQARTEIVQAFFTQIDAAHWLKMIRFFGAEWATESIAKGMESLTIKALAQLLSILSLLYEQDQGVKLIEQQMALLPNYFSEVLADDNKKLNADILKQLFWLEVHYPQSEAWVVSLAETISKSADRKLVHKVLVPQLLTLQNHKPLAAALLYWSFGYLQKLANAQPVMPTDWRREMPQALHYKNEWAILKAFMESPELQVFDYQQRQNERQIMEQAINAAKVDLRMETIKKGSPHTLRLIKTYDSYHRQMAEWNEDVRVFQQIEHKVNGTWIG
ncbi:MAG: 2OG-Fe(II) oxygenase [Chitinophagaceae bacterium]